ncbi:MAG: ATP-binding protein [Cyanobacteria bacterium P01_A01_bin.84]
MLDVNRLSRKDLNHISSNLFIAQAASTLVIAIGCLGLLNKSLQLESFLEALKNLVLMKQDVAVCFIFSGISLCLSVVLRREAAYSRVKPSTNPWHRRYTREVSATRSQQESLIGFPLHFDLSQGSQYLRFCAGICAITIFVIASFSLFQHFLIWDTKIYTLHLSEEFHSSGMGLNSGFNFILIAISLGLLSRNKHEASLWYVQILALIAGLVSWLSLIVYVYQVKQLYGVSIYASMTLHTALTFTILCAGILWVRADRGFMRSLTKSNYDSRMIRRWLILEICLPVIAGWLVIQGHQAGIYGVAFALAIFAIAVIIIFTGLIWQCANQLEKLTRQRDRARKTLLNHEKKLRGFVDANVIGILFGDIYGSIHEANEEFLRIIGYARSDLVSGNLNWTDITPPEYLHLDEQGIAAARENGACNPYEKEFIRKDGTRVSVLIGYALSGEKQEESVAFILDLSQCKQTEEALRQSEQRFRLAVDNFPDAFAIYDAQRKFQFVNLAAQQLMGKPKDDILGHTDEEVLSTSITQTYLPSLITAQQTLEAQTIEATVNSPELGKLTLSLKYVPVLDENGEIYQILAFGDDITLRKQAQDTLENQQKWLEDVLNMMPTPLQLIEPKTARVLFANRAASELNNTSYSADENNYSNAQGHPLTKEQMPIQRVARGEKLDGFEMDWYTPEITRSLLFFADTLPEMHGHPAVCVSIFQDISKLKQVEKALSLGYERQKFLFETASGLLSSQEPKEFIDQLFHKLAEQINLDYYFYYVVTDDPDLMRLIAHRGINKEIINQIEQIHIGEQICGTVAAERHPIALENLQQSRDPQTENARSIGIAAYYGYPILVQGKLLGTISFASRTRTSFSSNELGMMQAVCDQIAIASERLHLIHSLQQQTEQLQAANRFKDEFLAVLSHELRSPLNSILGWSQLLRSHKQLDVDKRTQALETIERNAKVQTRLVDDLLDISRMITGKLHLEVSHCNLTKIIKKAIVANKLAAQAKGISIQTQIQPDIEDIPGDRERLQQVVWNLLSNAIKFTPEGGCVEIKLDKIAPQELLSTTYVQIQVSDTGVGIPSERLPFIFERFYQADISTTRAYGGLGLGLAIARHIVELHGGSVKVTSLGMGKGATFTVNLPIKSI